MQAAVSAGVRHLRGSSLGPMGLCGAVAAAAVLALGGVIAPAVLAQDYPLESASASMEDVRLTPGGSTTVTGRGWLPGSTVTATLLPDSSEVAAQSEPRTLARTEVDAEGTFSMEVEIPDDLAPGDYLLRVSGTDEDGEPTRVEMTFTVEPDEEDLAREEEPADEEPADGEGPGGDEAPAADEGPGGPARDDAPGRDGIPVGDGGPASEGVPASEGPRDGEAPADDEAPAGFEEPPAEEGDPGASSLAVTGLGLLSGAVLGAVLVAAGWALLRVTRNRRTRIDV